MRKSLPALLIMLGAFFLVLALLTRFYAGSSLQRTPLDTDSTTRLTGTASLGGDAGVPGEGNEHHACRLEEVRR